MRHWNKEETEAIEVIVDIPLLIVSIFVYFLPVLYHLLIISFQ